MSNLRLKCAIQVGGVSGKGIKEIEEEIELLNKVNDVLQHFGVNNDIVFLNFQLGS